MRKILLFIIAFFCFGTISAQQYTDGCMTINMHVTDSWVQQFEDPFFADESAHEFWGADVANLDGQGWRGGACRMLTGYNYVGWRTIDEGGDDEVGPFSLYTLFTHTYGASGPNAANVPQFLQLRGEYVGEDCTGGSNCVFNSGFFTCFGDNDDYGYVDVFPGNINYRLQAPSIYLYTNKFTTVHGSSDYGAEVRTRWTAPRPTVTASTTEICSGATTSVTLNFSGAYAGSLYQVYDAGALVYSGTTASWTVSLTGAKTYQVYTRSNGIRSNCYSSITISTKNCNFNCETESYNTATAISPCQTNYQSIAATSLSFDGYGISSNSYIADVEVMVEVTGDADEMHIIFRSDNGGTEFSSLVDGDEGSTSAGCYFHGGTETNTNITWDEDDPTILGANYNPPDNDRLRATCGNAAGVEFDKWETWSTSSATDWWITANSDDIGCDQTFTINSYNVTICGCKPPTSGSASVTDGVNTSTASITICQEQGGTIVLSQTGSTSNYDEQGYGIELRWFSGSCGGTFIGSGNNLSVAAPTTPGTHQYYAEYYVDGERCRGFGNCDRVDVIVDASTVEGSVLTTVGSNASEDICLGTPASQLSLVGATGAVVIWEMSTDGATWSTVQTGGSTHTPSAFLGVNDYFIRANVKNGTCDTKVTDNFVLRIKDLPVGGTVTSLTPAVCNGSITTVGVGSYQGVIQWQESNAIGGPFTDVVFGGSTDTYVFFATNATTSPVTKYFRVEATNPPCAASYSNVYAIVIYPTIVPGTTTPNQMLCYNETPGLTTLGSYSGGSVVRWEVSTTTGFASPTTIANITDNLTGAEIQTAVGPVLSQTLYVRAVLDNLGCGESNSSYSTIRINDPDPIVGQNATGTCNINLNGFVHIYDPVTEDIIASIDGNGQNLGDVTVQVYYHANSYTVGPTTGTGPVPCTNPQAVMNRNFRITSTMAPDPAQTVGIRFYFTDAELADLISTAGCGDANGCADNDDVCSIADLYVTQISNAISEDGIFDPSDGDFLLHTPSKIGPGNANFGANYVQFNVNQFSEFWIHGSESGVPLPVEMLYFTATPVENSWINLDWSTATEINNAGFEIQRSSNGVDFETIAWEEGNGNTNQTTVYSYPDYDVSAGTYYYRLKQIDFNGDFEYTSIAVASIDKFEEDLVGNFIPNPADNHTSLDINLIKDSNVDIRIFNTIGQKVIVKDLELNAGNNRVDFVTTSLPGGTYSAVIAIDNDKLVTRKFIVTK